MNMIPDDTTPPELEARLRRLRETVATMQPPPALEAELTARVFPTAAAVTAGRALATTTVSTGIAARPIGEAPKPVRRTPTLVERWAAWIAWPVSVTATAGLVSWMVYTNPAVAPEQDYLAAVAAAQAAAAQRQTATPFLALAALDNIPSNLRGEVVSTTLPRATLAEFGLPVSPMRAAEPINAEFLVGANGGVLAVRFVDAADR